MEVHGRVEDVTIFHLRVTRMDTIGNEYTRGTAQVGRFGEKTRGKTEVVWTCTEERLWVYWDMDAEDGFARKEETGRSKRRFMDVVKEDNC